MNLQAYSYLLASSGLSLGEEDCLTVSQVFQHGRIILLLAPSILPSEANSQACILKAMHADSAAPRLRIAGTYWLFRGLRGCTIRRSHKRAIDMGAVI